MPMKSKTSLLSLLILFFAQLFAQFSFANEPVSTGYLNNIAIGKHDSVSYHLNAIPQKGDKRFAHEWQGAKWVFATAEQRDLFASNPEKYKPAYNGFCSNALTLNEGLIPTNGKVWHIFNDTLHLFFAERGRVRWVNGDYQVLRAQADQAWQDELAKIEN